MGAAIGDAYRRSNRVRAESGRGAGRKTFNEKPKRGLSNIPPSEGTGKGSPNDKKPAPRVSSPKTTKTARVTAPVVRKSVSKKGDNPSNSKSNPYRMPQGAERKDRMSKVVKELKAMQKASKARQNAQMPKKKVEKKLSRNEQNRRRRQGR